MKAKLEFNLPEETHELDQALKAGEYAAAWCEIKQYIRNSLKYDNITIRQAEILESVRDRMLEEERDRHLPEE